MCKDGVDGVGDEIAAGGLTPAGSADGAPPQGQDGSASADRGGSAETDRDPATDPATQHQRGTKRSAPDRFFIV